MDDRLPPYLILVRQLGDGRWSVYASADDEEEAIEIARRRRGWSGRGCRAPVIVIRTELVAEPEA